jgi:hypothetical protein
MNFMHLKELILLIFFPLTLEYIGI